MIWDRNIVTLPVNRKDEQGTEVKRGVVLTVGDGPKWLEQSRHAVTGQDVLLTGIHELSAEMLVALAPDLVLSPLLSPSFDCIDLATLLSEAGYRGKYRAISRKIPSPALVKREISDLCPGLDFDIIFLDAA